MKPICFQYKELQDFGIASDAQVLQTFKIYMDLTEGSFSWDYYCNLVS